LYNEKDHKYNDFCSKLEFWIYIPLSFQKAGRVWCSGARETTCHNGVTPSKNKEFLKSAGFLDLNGIIFFSFFWLPKPILPYELYFMSDFKNFLLSIQKERLKKFECLKFILFSKILTTLNRLIFCWLFLEFYWLIDWLSWK